MKIDNGKNGSIYQQRMIWQKGRRLYQERYSGEVMIVNLDINTLGG